MDDLWSQFNKKKSGIYKLQHPVHGFFTHVRVYHFLFSKRVEFFYETPPYKSVGEKIELLEKFDIDNENFASSLLFEMKKVSMKWRSERFSYTLINDKDLRLTMTSKRLS